MNQDARRTKTHISLYITLYLYDLKISLEKVRLSASCVLEI